MRDREECQALKANNKNMCSLDKVNLSVKKWQSIGIIFVFDVVNKVRMGADTVLMLIYTSKWCIM